MGYRRVPAVLIVTVLLTSTIPMGATAQQNFAVVPYEDLLFTELKTVEDVELLGDGGFIEATRGGLVVSTGEEGVRKVITRSEGLPSSVVWSIDRTAEGVLVGTEWGAAAVSLSDFSVETLSADGAASDLFSSHTFRVANQDGTWYVANRSGAVAISEDRGASWTLVDGPEGERANDLYVGPEHVILPMEGGPIYELEDDGTWRRIVDTFEQPIRTLVFDGQLFVGTRDQGLEAYTLEGDNVTLEQPANLTDRSVLRLVPFGDELWVGSSWGLYIYDPATGEWRSHLPDELPHPWVNDLAPQRSQGTGDTVDEAVLATPIGLAVPAEANGTRGYLLHTTSNGPITQHFTNIDTRRTQFGPEVWLTHDEGVSIYYPNERVWWHIGGAEGLRSTPVYDVELEGDQPWMGTDFGVYGLNERENEWNVFYDEEPALRPGNKFYDTEPDGDSVWMPELGNALIWHNFETNETRKYQIPDGLLSHAVSCAERWHEFLAVCSGESFQLFNLSRRSEATPLGIPYNFCRGYRCDSNYPANNTFDALPDGPRIWTATVDDGVVMFTRDEQEGIELTGHWNATDGLPNDQVRALAPADGGVWAGTIDGLARIDIQDGVVETWGREEGLDSEVINGLAELDGILYIATFAGLYRLDISEGDLLPLVESEGEIGSVPANMRISYPPRGSSFSAPFNMSGSTSAPGQTVERVEVRIDKGLWQDATGTTEWRFRVPVDELEPGRHQLGLRAIAGDETVTRAWRNITVLGPGEGGPAPTLEHEVPDQAPRGSLFDIEATVDGAEPLKVTMDAIVAGQRQTVEGRIVGDDATFSVRIPQDARGKLSYRFDVQSGGGERVIPEIGYHSVPIVDPRVRSMSFDLEGTDDGTITVEQGNSTRLSGWIENAGNRAEKVRLSVSGLRPSWITVQPTEVQVPAGDRVGVDLVVEVPDDARTGSTSLTVQASSFDGELTSTRSLTINVPAPETDGSEEDRGIPAPGAVVLLVLLPALAGLTVAARRRGT